MPAPPTPAGASRDAPGLPAALDLVHELVGLAEQAVEVALARSGVRGTDADPDPGHAGLEEERAAQVDLDAAAQPREVLVGGAGDDDDELVTAHAAEHAVLAHAALQPAGHLLEQLVARGVAEGVVDRP